MVVVLLAVSPMPAQTPQNQLLARDNLNNGVRAFREANYDAAIADFLRAAELDPDLTAAELYLGVAYSRQFVSGGQSPQNQQFATKAIGAFENVLKKQPDNIQALDGLAAIFQNSNQLQKAREAYLKGSQLDPKSPTRFYAVGSVDWLMLQAKTTPLPLQQQMQLINEGLQNLNLALVLDPQYEDAMAYTNLMLREQAKLSTDDTEKKRLTAMADDWFNKVLATRKAKQGKPITTGNTGLLTTPAPPPPPPAPLSPPPAGVTRPRVSTAVMLANLVSKPPFTYPAEARAQRVHGEVIIEAIIDTDGGVSEARVITGHDLLWPTALENVKQWHYLPFVQFGKPTSVVTTITVNFTLP
jgi:TonB family protein